MCDEVIYNTPFQPDSNNESQIDDLDESTAVGCVDDIIERFNANNITLVDIVSHYETRYNSKQDMRYKPNRSDMDLYHIEYMSELIPDIVREVDREYKESILFGIEDDRLSI